MYNVISTSNNSYIIINLKLIRFNKDISQLYTISHGLYPMRYKPKKFLVIKNKICIQINFKSDITVRRKYGFESLFE